MLQVARRMGVAQLNSLDFTQFAASGHRQRQMRDTPRGRRRGEPGTAGVRTAGVQRWQSQPTALPWHSIPTSLQWICLVLEANRSGLSLSPPHHHGSTGRSELTGLIPVCFSEL